MPHPTRRDFMASTAAVIGATTLPTLAGAAGDNGRDSLRVLQIGVGPPKL